MKQIIWVLVNCNTVKEADKIGRALLKMRLVSCFDIFKRLKTEYFWPPKKGTIQTGRGALLILETLPTKFEQIIPQVKKLHSDKLPFIGSFPVKVEDAYQQWMKGEIK